MRKSRISLLALLALAGTTVGAQGQAVIAGQTTMTFDHVPGDTTGYELCVDTVTEATCQPITVSPALPAEGSDAEMAFSFVVPAGVPRGARVLRVRAVWPGGVSGASAVATFRAVVQPGAPGPVRLP